MFIDNLIEKIKSKKSHVVVGLDPDYNKLPSYLLKNAKSLEDISNSIFEFNSKIIESIYDIVPAIKPQIAFYERLGTAGINVFMKTIKLGKEKGLIVIEDAKRNDIGSTAVAYSEGHLGRIRISDKQFPAFDVDAITVNAYLGSDGIIPFTKDVHSYHKGIFVLVKTSNKTSTELQDITVMYNDKKTYKLYEIVAKLVHKWGKDYIGTYGYSSIGAVVGATFPNDAKILRKLMPHTYFLVPGYGAQGGKAEDIIHSFNKDGLGALISASRSIIFAYQKDNRFKEKHFAEAARAAVIKMNSDINETLKRNDLLIWNS